MTCTSCGRPLPDGDKFCRSCGTPAATSGQAAAAQTGTPAEALRAIAEAALAVIRPVVARHPDVPDATVYFQPTASYADSWLRAERTRPSILRPVDGTTPISTLVLAITMRPGVAGKEWIGYTFDIKDPQGNPELTNFWNWPESGGQDEMAPEKLPGLMPHVLAMLAGPQTSGDDEPPREAPDSMY